jgi:endonuclease YncB( thermonuclease family)
MRRLQVKTGVAAAVMAIAASMFASGCSAVTAVDKLLGPQYRNAKTQVARVDHNVDGDTLSVDLGQRRAYVRVIGIDTPEEYGVSEPECGAEAAARSMAHMAPPGTKVKLVSDPTQDLVDRYGRKLRYVELASSGKDLGGEQVKRGWADVYVYYESGPAKRVPQYRRYQAQAKAAHRGVFGVCGGDFHSEGD